MSSVLSLGANLGDRLANLQRGLAVVAMHVPVSAVSAVYETAPIGGEEQPAYLNAVARVDSDDPQQVFAAAQAAEVSQARLRSRRWGPRTLDVDVIAVDAIVSSDPRLTLPHPRAAQRAFVLLPWLDIDRNAQFPGGGSVAALADRLADQQVRRTAARLVLP
ncbi:MAG TPA: 2-amino-4-hydroxy-6-hydroxymethyldihydropteridine diphosphokinase [Mycobacteriales bacterium]|jgi:2-amino-4-hydroxy-6-hydroxymethyldihydropteridine diphosphokinase|nr:2-amino-4-hydroxy-6-hydroxymethyldihydropteridine diphosphokinase [Mycobacteriales bacterium]